MVMKHAGTMRRELVKKRDAVLKEYHALKNEMRGAAAYAEATANPSDYKDKQRRLSWLKEREEQLQEEIRKLKQVSRVRQARRERLFLDLVRKRLGEEVYREIWAEIDRLEGEQWSATWSENVEEK